MSVRKHLLQWKYTFRSTVSREPLLAPLHRLIVWWTQAKMRGHIDTRECRVGPDTELVLDGFQGTANSFATRAFKMAQDRSVRIAHHLHAPAQIIKGARNGIPTIVTIRNPIDAAASLLSRWPYISPDQALRSYARFYEKLEPYKDRVIVSPFSQTTGHLDRVFEALNRRFDTDFAVFEHTEGQIRDLRDPAALQSREEQRRRSRKTEAKQTLGTDSSPALRRRASTIHRHLQAFGIGQLARIQPSPAASNRDARFIGNAPIDEPHAQARRHVSIRRSAPSRSEIVAS